MTSMSLHVSSVSHRNEAKGPRSSVRLVEVSVVDGEDGAIREGNGDEEPMKDVVRETPGGPDEVTVEEEAVEAQMPQAARAP